MTVTIRLTRIQAAFKASEALYRGYVGGRGSGKSFGGAYDLIRRAKAGRLYGAYAPTYPMLRDASLRSLLEIGENLHFIKAFNKTDMIVTLGNGAEILARSLDDPERARGPNLSGAWIDETGLVKRAAFDIIIASLREGGEQGWLSATFTPKGRSHWTYKTFGMGAPDTALFRARTLDNPFLPAGFYHAVRGQYTGQYAEQELDGQFVDIEGGLAQRAWFGIVDAAPEGAVRCRHWDFAATAPKDGYADYTVGTLLSAKDGTYIVEDVIRQRVGPGAVEALVQQTAELDGHNVAIGLEEEPGASGKLMAAAFIKRLAGWNVKALRATGDKVTRAMPFLAQAEAGNVKLVRALWNSAWLEEFAAFPVGAHDDQVDSASGAFELIGRVPTGRLFY